MDSTTTTLDRSKIINDVDFAISEMVRLLASLDQEKLNRIPFDNSWRAAQVGQHILMSIKGMPGLLRAPSVETDRDPAEKLPMIKNIFENYESKMSAPEMIIPEAKDYDKQELIEGLENAKRSIMEGAGTVDLTRESTVFELPGMGPFTFYEWLSFVTIHTTRHNHQLRGILDVVI